MTARYQSRRRRKESLINPLLSRKLETPYVVSYGEKLFDNGLLMLALSIFHRIFPHPIALSFVKLSFTRNAAVVFFVPADGIENKPAIVGAAVFEGFAGDHVVGQAGGKARDERLEVFGELAVGQAVSFQRAGNGCLIGGGLGTGPLRLVIRPTQVTACLRTTRGG